MLEVMVVMVVMIENNLQFAIAKNSNPLSAFTVVTNLMYDLPPECPPQQVGVSTQTLIVHISLYNEVPTIHIDEDGHIFKRNVPKFQGAHLMTKIKHSLVVEVVEISCDLEK